MIPQSKGKMFLASERGHTETDWFRSYNTFQFGNYQDPDKVPFGSLYGLNNDTLGGGKKILLTVEVTSDFILIPVVGSVVYTYTTGNPIQIEAGQAFRTTIVAGTIISFENPYEESLINFLHLWLKKVSLEKPLSPEITDFNLEEKANQLIKIFPFYPAVASEIFIGKFEGRYETKCTTEENKGLFFYVVEGAFEVQYRLLETGDGLALWDTHAAEIEALSNNAIILIVKILMDS